MKGEKQENSNNGGIYLALLIIVGLGCAVFIALYADSIRTCETKINSMGATYNVTLLGLQNRNIELKTEFIGLLQDLNRKFNEAAFQGMACKEWVRCQDSNALECNYNLEIVEYDCFGDSRITDKQNDFTALIQRATNKYGN